MTEYLPEIYTRFREANPEVAAALDNLARSVDGAGPLDEKTGRLVKLGIAIGAMSEGAVRSNTRKALGAGASPADLRHAGLQAITTIGFPAAVAVIGWIEEVLTSGD